MTLEQELEYSRQEVETLKADLRMMLDKVNNTIEALLSYADNNGTMSNREIRVVIDGLEKGLY